MAILIVVSLAVAGVIFYGRIYVRGFESLLDELEQSDQKENVMEEMKGYYHRHSVIAHSLVPLSRMEDIEALLYKLDSYVKTGDINEIYATASELRIRVRMVFPNPIWH